MKSFKEFFNEEDLQEVAIKPQTARFVALALLTKIIRDKKKVATADTTDRKIDALSDMIVDGAYLSALAVAVEQGDGLILRRLRLK